jgi:adenine C2-methylase RlmN of 23S rRNA A2503 and tRNA A37
MLLNGTGILAMATLQPIKTLFIRLTYQTILVIVINVIKDTYNLSKTILVSFINVINDQNGLHIGARHITLSTSGIVPKIYEFTEFPKQVNLAISLHAPNNEIRSKIMKINDVYPIELLMESIENYINVTNRRVSFEYILLKGVNDKDRGNSKNGRQSHTVHGGIGKKLPKSHFLVAPIFNQ